MEDAGSEDWSDVAAHHGMPADPEADDSGIDSPLVSGESAALRTPRCQPGHNNWGLLASGTVRKYFVVVLSH